MRWDATADLIEYETVVSDDGSRHRGEAIVSTVFCNRNTVGQKILVGWTDTSTKPVAAVQLRTFDYGGQGIVVMEGIEYTVEQVSRRGDFTTLVLGRMGRNA